MSKNVSTITSKWQVTIPEEIRTELPIKIGHRIAWEVKGDKLVGHQVRSILQLGGSLKAARTSRKNAPQKDGFAQAALSRHDRIARQGP